MALQPTAVGTCSREFGLECKNRQSFLAETSISQELSGNERVKIMCVRHIAVGRQVT
jgi:hypothetical protein